MGDPGFTFVLPYPPSANKYWRNVNGRMVVSEAARNYKTTVGLMVRRGMKQPLAGEVKVNVAVYRPRKSGDLDNSLKILLDSLKGTAYIDDDQVVEIHAMRGDDKNNPRVVLTVIEL